MARIKKLPIRDHDTTSYRGPRRVGQVLSEKGYDAANDLQDPLLRDSMTGVLSSIVEHQRAKGTHGGPGWSRAVRSKVERLRTLERVYIRDDPIARLKMDTQRATDSFANSLRRSGIVAADQGPKRQKVQRERMSNLHNVQAKMMVIAALKPLRQGVSSQAVLKSMGMMTMMYMMSPNVRELVAEYRPGVKRDIEGRIVSKSQWKDDQARAALAGAEAHGLGKESLSRKWRKRLDKIDYAERGYREPFTPSSAAMVEIGLAESAYAAMRDPSVPADQRDAHTQEIAESYTSAMQVLNEYIEADGLDREDVSRASRILVGQRLKNEPGLAGVFNELGHGRFVKGGSQQIYTPGALEPRSVWTGAFTDVTTGKDISKGSFSLRIPGNRAEHLDLCAETLQAELEQAVDVEELNEIFTSYTAGSVMRLYPDMVNEVEDPMTRLRMRRAGTMFSSMRADGLSQSDQRFVYAASFVQAMEGIGEKRPELLTQWEAQLGPEWQADVREMVSHYSDMGVRAENKVLVEALVDRGFDRGQAQTEVEDYRASQEDPSAPLLEPEPDEGVPVQPWTTPEPQAWSAPTIGRRMDPDLHAALLVDDMSGWIASDLAWEADRAGFYEAGGTELMQGPGDGTEVYVGAEVFVSNAMVGYERPEASIQLGRDHETYREIGVGDPTPPAIMRRHEAIMEMNRSLEALGYDQAARDQMLSAAYVNGLEKLIAEQPHCALAVDNSVLESRGKQENWRDALFNRTMQATTSNRDLQARHRLEREKVSTPEMLEKIVAAQASKDPARRGYGAWERYLSRLDETEVVGQDLGEMDVPGADTAHDQVSAEVQTLGGHVTASEQARRRRARSAVTQNIQDQINQDYNRTGGKSGGITGLGTDQAQVLQDSDPTLGYEGNDTTREMG